MTKATILEELARLSPADLVDVQAKLDELSAQTGVDNGKLTDEDKQALGTTLAEYKKFPRFGQFLGGGQGKSASQVAFTLSLNCDLVRVFCPRDIMSL